LRRCDLGVDQTCKSASTTGKTPFWERGTVQLGALSFAAAAREFPIDK
jgi:hypothetical protein